MDYTAYLESLNEAENVVEGMFRTVEREIEWCLNEHDKDAAYEAKTEIYKGLTNALNAIEAQKEICIENL